MALKKVFTTTEYHIPLNEALAALGLTVSRDAIITAGTNGGTLIISVTENERADGGFHPSDARRS